MYRQPACRWLGAIHPAVGYHYFPPGLRLPSHLKSVTAHRPVPNYTAWWQEAHACEQLAQGCYLEEDRTRFEPTTFWIVSERSTIKPHRPRMIMHCDEMQSLTEPESCEVWIAFVLVIFHNDHFTVLPSNLLFPVTIKFSILWASRLETRAWKSRLEMQASIQCHIQVYRHCMVTTGYNRVGWPHDDRKFALSFGSCYLIASHSSLQNVSQFEDYHGLYGSTSCCKSD